MLHHAYYWKRRALDRPGPVALYVKAWGRRGDTAVVAIEDGFPVGAAWYRLFGNDRPDTASSTRRPSELAIAVVPSARGRGVGTKLSTRSSPAPARRPRRALARRRPRQQRRDRSLRATRLRASGETEDTVTMLAHLEKTPTEATDSA